MTIARVEVDGRPQLAVKVDDRLCATSLSNQRAATDVTAMVGDPTVRDEPEAISDSDAGLGVAVRWNANVLPYAWFWQELHASSGYPWYRSAYVTVLEPNTSYPGQGLGTVIAKTGTHQMSSPWSRDRRA